MAVIMARCGRVFVSMRASGESWPVTFMARRWGLCLDLPDPSGRNRDISHRRHQVLRAGMLAGCCRACGSLPVLVRWPPSVCVSSARRGELNE